MELTFKIIVLVTILLAIGLFTFEDYIKKGNMEYPYISVLVIFCILSIALLSVRTNSVEKKSMSDNELVDTLRACNVNNGMIRAIFVDHKINVYQEGDTVWVNQNTNRIEPITMSTKFAVKDLVLYVVEDRPFSLRKYYNLKLD